MHMACAYVRVAELTSVLRRDPNRDSMLERTCRVL